MDLRHELFPIDVVFTENVDTMSEVAAQFLEQGKQCLCFLRGASKEVFTGKLLCTLAGVAYEKLQNGTVGEAEWAKVMDAANRLLCGNLQIDSSAMRDEEILAQCKRFPSANVVLILSLAK